MRSIWSGALSFGLVNIPVKLYGASEESGLKFHFLHEKDLSPVRYARICKEENTEIPYGQIIRGYEMQKNDYIPLSEDDFKKADVKKTNTIEIQDFVKELEIDPVYFERPYYLEPDKAGKPYALLREALRRAGKVGVAKFVLRNREYVGMVKPRGKVLVLEQLRFAEEVRSAEGLNLPGEKEVKQNELKMAMELIKQLSADFKPEKYKDVYSEELKAVIAAKSKGRKPKAKGKVPELTPVSDLMAALKASLNERETQKTKA